ncbi:hypothetical protein [Paraglaciecola sp.]|uniref:hypothetical protein n=1 Tax=Paraglaciecola sp. TaxID=1920173 RepID=UPI0030F441F1
MKRLITSIGLLIASIILPTQAAIISIVPQDSASIIGEQLVVDLTISDLGHQQASSLSSFDINFLFDDNLLALQSVDFGNQLDLFGLGALLGGLQVVTNFANGVINLVELSADSVNDLNAFQAGSFVLATLAFNVIGNGTADFFTQVNSLGDANGIALPNVELVGATVNVAEPSMALLLALGLAGLVVSRRFRALKN